MPWVEPSLDKEYFKFNMNNAPTVGHLFFFFFSSFMFGSDNQTQRLIPGACWASVLLLCYAPSPDIFICKRKLLLHLPCTHLLCTDNPLAYKLCLSVPPLFSTTPPFVYALLGTIEALSIQNAPP